MMGWGSQEPELLMRFFSFLSYSDKCDCGFDILGAGGGIKAKCLLISVAWKEIISLNFLFHLFLFLLPQIYFLVTDKIFFPEVGKTNIISKHSFLYLCCALRWCIFATTANMVGMLKASSS